MPKNTLLQGSLDLLLLKILSRQPGLHGYAIMLAIEEMSDEVLRAEEGTLYPALRRLEEAGLLSGAWTTKENGRRTRVYKVTKKGQTQLEAEQARWHSVTSAVNRILGMA